MFLVIKWRLFSNRRLFFYFILFYSFLVSSGVEIPVHAFLVGDGIRALLSTTRRWLDALFPGPEFDGLAWQKTKKQISNNFSFFIFHFSFFLVLLFYGTFVFVLIQWEFSVLW